MGYESAGKVKTAKFSLCSFTKPLQVCSEEMEQNPPPLLRFVYDCTNIKRSHNKLS